MLATTLIILGYLVIAGITAGILVVTDTGDGVAIFYGLLWPISIPFLIAAYLVFCIAWLIEDLVDFIRFGV